MGEWGKIGVGYKMGSTAYGIEAVLGGVGYLLICSVLYKCSTVQLFSGVVMLRCNNAALQNKISAWVWCVAVQHRYVIWDMR
jgi:hypothetical protein